MKARRFFFSKNLTTSMTCTLALAGALIIGVPVSHASGPAFDGLNKDKFDKVIRELSGNSSYHSVTGAGSLGDVFGFEIGLVGGLTSTPEINSISKSVDASADVGRLPHASILAAVSVPFGITGEVLLFPSVEIGDVKYQQFGGAIKWTANDVLPVLPFNLAVRAFVTQNELSFKQKLQNVSTGGISTDVTVTQDNSQFGLQLLASPSLPFVEPYIGIGTVNATGKLKVSGHPTGTIFDPTLTTSQSAESSPSSFQFLAGVNASLVGFKFGLEYSRVFETDSFNFKLGFGF
ncbi:MAG: hypothetical protein RBT63_11515 [Bdellovibrionales bacterium]|jgi:hypothetical protein|nr:hypothetical protein [Bdellovibrionales bacterium]